jgi:8-oxo-dGTP pyrophosphatase MutT (NUDIX family)
MDDTVILNLENVSDEEASTFRQRFAARCVVVDENNDVALLHSLKHGFYMLPGGKIEEDETPEQAAIRECKEEIGCDVKVIAALGKTIEHRKQSQQSNISYGFLMQQYGTKEIPIPAGDEAELEAVVEWHSLESAIGFIKERLEGKNMTEQQLIKRDVILVEKASEYLRN